MDGSIVLCASQERDRATQFAAQWRRFDWTRKLREPGLKTQAQRSAQPSALVRAMSGSKTLRMLASASMELCFFALPQNMHGRPAGG